MEASGQDRSQLSDSDTKSEVRPLLLLTSHAHSPPLQPPPDLKYDLRTTPNPPKNIRDSFKGVSKRLRQHMLTNDKFVSLLETAEADIRNLMHERIQKWVADQAMAPKLEVPTNPETLTKTDVTDAENDNTDGPQNKAEEDDDEATHVGNEGDDDANRPTVRVGCFCSRGHHRSVAFVEELALRPWPKEWGLEVRITHRDLFKNRHKKKRQHEDRMRRRNSV